MQDNSSRIWFWAIVVSLGGFLFGFDTAVISGVEQTIQAQWGLSDGAVGQAVAVAIYGTIIGALFGGIPADRFGRKKTLYLVGLLYFISALWSALSPDLTQLVIARFIGGIGVGISSVVAPLYLTEIAPAKMRGQVVAAFQFNLVLGIFVAYFSNYLIASEDPNIWRYMLGVEAIPAFIYLLLLARVPRSPRWLTVKAEQPQEALGVLILINPETAEQQLAEIKASESTSSKVAIGEFFTKKYSRPILLAFLFAAFNQLSGINAVIYYGPRIFESAGLEGEDALLSTVGIGLINLIFTMLGMYLIDRFGRKRLMYLGSIGYIISLSLMAAAFQYQWSGQVVAVATFAFIASHAIGQGAVIWVFISEIFDNEVRSLGAALGSTTHWVFAALITATFPSIRESLGPVLVFSVFAGFMVLQLLFVAYMMPETKGQKLEEMQL